MENLPIDSGEVLAWKRKWQKHSYEKRLFYCICGTDYEVFKPCTVACETGKAGKHIQRFGRLCVSHGWSEVDY